MTPEERAYKILQNSNFILSPEDDPRTKVDEFLKSIDGCTWENPIDKIQERQFETSLKSCFVQYADELIKFAKENPPTFDGEPSNDSQRGLHTMDDQGFEGQVIGDGSFYRWIKDEENYNIQEKVN